MKKPTKTTVIVVTLCVLTIAGGAAYYLTSGKPAEQPTATSNAAPKPALTVTAGSPKRVLLPIKLAANGNIAAWQEAIIGAETMGLRLTDVRVNVGDMVKAGQVLATFSTDSVQADMAQARASLLEAQANASDAAANAERARTLLSSGALSAQQINQYLTLEKTANARAEAAQAVLSAQQLRGRQTKVLAPDAGVISARTATVGAVVGNGAELFRMIRQGRLEWRAEVTSSELGQIKEGVPVSVIPASGGELRGKVRMVAPSVDPNTRSALVYVDLPAAATQATPAKAGMFARGEFELGATSALTVPQQALVMRDGFSYLFRIGADNRVKQVKVQTGRMAGDQVEVISGLQPEARLVIQGAGFLNDGDLVRVSQGSDPAKAVSSALDVK